MHPHQAYSAFVRTFEAGSFSAVAREMGTSQSAISKQIAALEVSLGVQLFARTTRRLQPTAEALALYGHVRQLLDAVETLKTVHGLEAKASGTLRMSLPSAYGRHQIGPLLPKFLARFPNVRLDILLTDQAVDLIEEGLELGIRIGDLEASTLVTRSLGTIEYFLVATPEYLKRRGVPESPVDLVEHACILYSGGSRGTRWEFESENGRHAVEVSGPTYINDPDAMYGLVRADQGIALVPNWIVGDDIASGRVRWLLQDYYPLAQPVSVVYPQTRFLSQRARSFIDFVLAEQRPAR
jgi:DNA-binding transcriptional LysR family regulator